MRSADVTTCSPGSSQRCGAAVDAPHRPPPLAHAPSPHHPVCAHACPSPRATSQLKLSEELKAKLAGANNDLEARLTTLLFDYTRQQNEAEAMRVTLDRTLGKLGLITNQKEGIEQKLGHLLSDYKRVQEELASCKAKLGGALKSLQLCVTTAHPCRTQKE